MSRRLCGQNAIRTSRKAKRWRSRQRLRWRPFIYDCHECFAKVGLDDRDGCAHDVAMDIFDPTPARRKPHDRQGH
jgi:hypothetical protein